MRGLIRGIERSYLKTSAYSKKTAPCVFLEMATKTKQERLRIKLYENINPEAADNFKQMCMGLKTEKGDQISYAGKKFVNSLQNYFVETERIDETNQGGPILNETYNVKFDRPGLVGLSQHQEAGLEVSGSGFFITLHKMPNLVNYVAVGEVIEGLEFVRECNRNEEEIEIKACGVENDVHI